MESKKPAEMVKGDKIIIDISLSGPAYGGSPLTLLEAPVINNGIYSVQVRGSVRGQAYRQWLLSGHAYPIA